MIGFIRGKILTVLKNSIILDTGSIGYRIFLSEKECLELSEEKEIELYIFTLVRENEITLIGLKDSKELILFEMLITVNGVGPKTAKMLLGEIGYDRIIDLVLSKNSKDLKVAGVGKKTSEKIIIDLYDKLLKFGFEKRSEVNNFGKCERNLDDIFDAVKSLGYKSSDIEKLKKDKDLINEISDLSEQEILKIILKRIK